MYTTADKVKQMTGIDDESPSISAFIDDAIRYACTWIDSYTGSSFSDDPATKSYAATGSSTIRIPYTKTITTITYGGNSYPESGDTFDWSHEYVTFKSTIPQEGDTIDVTGIQGYGPQDQVEFCATRIAADILKNRVRSTGEHTKMSLDGVSFDYSLEANINLFAEVRTILDQYRTSVV